MDNRETSTQLLKMLTSVGGSSLYIYLLLLKKCGVSDLESKDIITLLKNDLDNILIQSDNSLVKDRLPQELSDSLKDFDLYLLKNGISSYFPNLLRREIALRRRELLDDPDKNIVDDMIYFSDVDRLFGEFSNFSNHAIYLDRLIWQTTEHYYQAAKYTDLSKQNEIRLAVSPVLAKEISRYHSDHIVSNWNEIKEAVMLKAISAKFIQHPELKNLLISTQNKKIIELSKSDTFWGDPGDGSGKNKLGCILMMVRDNIRKERE